MIPPSQRGRRTSRLGKPSRHSSSGDTRTTNITNSGMTNKHATQHDDCIMSDGLVEVQNGDTNFLDDYIFPTTVETDTMPSTGQVLDFSSLLTGTTSSTSIAPGYLSTPDPTLGSLGSLFGTNYNGEVMDMGTFQGLQGQGECNCHAGVTELLACMRGNGSSNDQRLSLDAQLARLKQCIVASETSMGCIHSRDDSEPIYIMAVTMLIGYVIDDFKMLANESSLRRSASLSSSSSSSGTDLTTLATIDRGNKSSVATPSSTTTSLGDLIEPRLSWGVLELEEDDELDLRQRLYLLSFRKLERLLSQLTLHLRDQHNALASLPDPSRHMAFVIACDYARLWLERKAGDVKRLFSVPTRDETMNSVLV